MLENRFLIEIQYNRSIMHMCLRHFQGYIYPQIVNIDPVVTHWPVVDALPHGKVLRER